MTRTKLLSFAVALIVVFAMLLASPMAVMAAPPVPTPPVTTGPTPPASPSLTGQKVSPSAQKLIDEFKNKGGGFPNWEIKTEGPRTLYRNQMVTMSASARPTPREYYAATAYWSIDDSPETSVDGSLNGPFNYSFGLWDLGSHNVRVRVCLDNTDFCIADSFGIWVSGPAQAVQFLNYEQRCIKGQDCYVWLRLSDSSKSNSGAYAVIDFWGGTIPAQSVYLDNNNTWGYIKVNYTDGSSQNAYLGAYIPYLYGADYGYQSYTNLVFEQATMPNK